MAGVDVAHTGPCETPMPMVGASATPTCAPDDGPAWSILFTNGAPMCARGPGIIVDVWDALESAAPGTVYSLGANGQGHAALCPSAHSPCLLLTGTITLEAWTTNVSGSVSFDLMDPAGGHVRGDHVPVELWCASQRQCG